MSRHFHFCSILLLLYLFILRTQNLILLMFLYFFCFFIEPFFFILKINNLSSQPNILFLRFSLKYLVQIRLKFQINILFLCCNICFIFVQSTNILFCNFLLLKVLKTLFTVILENALIQKVFLKRKKKVFNKI